MASRPTPLVAPSRAASPASRGKPAPTTFTFENLGPVRTARLELGDLTILAGRNNTGKTYLAYTLYGFLKFLRDVRRVHRLLQQAQPSLVSSSAFLRQITSHLEEHRDGAEPEAVRIENADLQQEQTAVVRHLAGMFSKHELAGVFSSASERFEGASLAIELGEGGWPPSDVQSAELGVSAGEVYFRRGPEETVAVRFPLDRLRLSDSQRRDVSFSFYLGVLLPGLLELNPFVLTAERIGISLFYRELDSRKSQLIDMLQKYGDSDRGDHESLFDLLYDTVNRYAGPIKDNIDYTRDLPDLRQQKSEICDASLHNYIRRLMSGYYTVSGDGSIEFRSVSRGDRRFSIPLHLASSSARGLSDLYFFLRHVARKNQLLIIDEPESHLDTLNQILLARLLARLVRAGVRVLVSTHSDYLIKELNNLIMLSSNFEKKAEVMKRRNYEEADCLDPERVRAYIAKENTLVQCEIDKFGIEMPSFDETINSINSVANELAAWLSVKESE